MQKYFISVMLHFVKNVILDDMFFMQKSVVNIVLCNLFVQFVHIVVLYMFQVCFFSSLDMMWSMF